jgi:hypothetical protein
MPSLEHTVASVPEGTINLERTYYLADGDTIRIAEWPGVVVVTEGYVQGTRRRCRTRGRGVGCRARCAPFSSGGGDGRRDWRGR